MDVGDDLNLGLDWISSHYLQHFFQAGQVGLRSGLAQLHLALLPSAARLPTVTLSTAIGYGELCRLLRQIVRDPPAGPATDAPVEPATATRPSVAEPRGWSRPVQADHHQ